MKATAAVPAGARALAARATRDALLKAATQVFARHGYDGGRIEQIASAAGSHDRMIYYYFGSKEGLFVAVLAEMYRRFDEAEAALAIDVGRPAEALAAVVRFMWHYYRRHPEFITLLNAENLHRGRHLAKPARARGFCAPAVATLARVLTAGVARGVFRADAAPRDIYRMTAALGGFYLSNRFTLAALLGEPLDTPAALGHWEAFVLDAVGRTVARGGVPRAAGAA